MNELELYGLLFKPFLREFFKLYLKNNINPQQFHPFFEGLKAEALTQGISEEQFIAAWLPELHDFFRVMGKAQLEERAKKKKG